MAEISSWELVEIKRDILQAQLEASQRGLYHSAKWAAELSFTLDQVSAAECCPAVTESTEFLAELERYTLAKSYYDLREFSRAAHFAQSCSSPKARFLYYYSLYQAGGKKALDDAPDNVGSHDCLENDYLKNLRFDLNRQHKAGELDGYTLYLYGVVLKKLDLVREALDVLIEAVCKEPLHWGSWHELSLLVPDKEMLSNLAVPDHWMKQFFLAQAYLELQMNEEALKIYQNLSEFGFSKSTYLMAQTALVHHNTKEQQDLESVRQSEALTCRYCGRIYKSRSSWRKHQKTHEDNKPLLCLTCGVGPFFSRSNLVRHSMAQHLSHTYTCELCQKSYKYESDCKQHKKNCGVEDTPGTRFKCSHCGKLYKKKKYLTKHLRIIEGQSHPCAVCGEDFTSRSSLSHHKKRKHATG